MSLQLINRSPDLRKLQDEGYELEIRSNHLLVKNIPYLTSQKEVRRGILVSTLTLAGDKTTTPDDHQAHFFGEMPSNEDGSPIAQILNQSVRRTLGPGVEIDHSFSAKPKENGGRYVDYHAKMSTYAHILSGPAQVVDPTATSKTFAVIPTESDSVFQYVDTASSRASIGAITSKLLGEKIAIVGAGGTGSYILDQVAKTPVSKIHVFDGDVYLQHNAFRSPGAPSIDVLSRKPNKAEYFAGIYSRMHKGVVAHQYYVDQDNVTHLKDMSFVFICIDNGPAKKVIVEYLEAQGISFIDVGMGVYNSDGQLGGVIRVTASTPRMRSHIREKGRISFGESSEANEYNQNIQISELNGLNAMLAIIKWKKMMGIYLDFEGEHFSTFTIDGNALNNDDFGASGEA